MPGILGPSHPAYKAGGILGELRASGILGRVAETWPAKMAQAAYSGATLPGDVYAGRAKAEDVIPRSLDLAGLVGIGSAFDAIPLKTLESRTSSLYNLPSQAPRAFSKDYSNVAGLTDGELLVRTIDGDPITTGRIAGRRLVGGEDQAIKSEEFDAIAKEATRRDIAYVSAGSEGLGRNAVGSVAVNDASKRPLGVLVSNKLTGVQAEKVTGHEIGHVIDQLAGEIPPSAVSELKQLYSFGLSKRTDGGRLATRNLTGPQHLKYSKEDVPREFMAEAIRLYMNDPNAMKELAPNAAKAIRKAVNTNPSVNKIIQFNASGLPPMGLTTDEPAAYDRGDLS